MRQNYKILLAFVLVFSFWTLCVCNAFGEVEYLPLSQNQQVDEEAKSKILSRFFKTPLHFVENQGQLDEKVVYYAKADGATVYCTEQGLVFGFENGSISLKFSEDKRVRPEVQKQLLGKVNYFIGNNRSAWHTDIPTYQKVIYREVYDGIDLVYSGNQRRLKYTFYLQPNSDPNQIKMIYDGIEGLSVDDATGELVIQTSLGEMQDDAPTAYQVIDGVRKEVGVSFRVIGKNSVGFRVRDYDPNYTLVIDPGYSTYLGGSRGYDIAVDSEGNAYVTGKTTYFDLPTKDAYQGSSGGKDDAFVTKLSSRGDTLVYSTFLGGSKLDVGYGIAVDRTGNAYVTGYTRSSDFPTENPYQESKSWEGSDAFVTKLSSNGNTLIYSTYLGGFDSDYGKDIAVDSEGNAYITGNSRPKSRSISPSSFPGFPDAHHRYGNSSDNTAFVAKLSHNGDKLIYLTFLGGSDDDQSNSIAVDSEGNAYITGYTKSSDFPTKNPFQGVYSGNGDRRVYGGDAFVTKLSSSGDTLIYSTFLGGSDRDYGSGIAVDSEGNVYVTGGTNSDDFLTENPYQSSKAGNGDAFVTKLSSSGDKLIYSTYLGGSAGDGSTGIAVDSEGNAYITGSANSSDFPTFNPYQGGPGGAGNSDAFVTKLSSSGNSLIYSTYLGGNSIDVARSIAVDSEGNAYVTGQTFRDFPTFNPYQGSPGGDEDVFVTSFWSDGTLDTIPPSTVTNLSVSNQTHNSVTLKWTAPGDDEGVGTARKYDIRYSTSPITEDSWDTATECQGEPQPQASGNTETFKVESLSPETTYYFAIEASDEVPHWSQISNIAQGKTKPLPPVINSISPTSGLVGTQVTISGNNFENQQNASIVTFRGIDAGVADNWTDTEIKIKVPAGAMTGSVVVTVGGQASNSDKVFTVVQPPVLISYEPDPTNDAAPTLDWHDVSGASGYHIQIDDNANFSSPIVEDNSLTQSEYTPSSPLPEGKIYWRVSSIDRNGKEGDFSDVDDFTIDITPPYIPTLIPYTPDPTNNRKPTMDWADVVDAEVYHLQIADSEDFSNLIVDEDTLTDSEYTPISDSLEDDSKLKTYITYYLPEGIIYWRVKSIDIAGNESDYSDIDSFTIDLTPPSVPLLVEYTLDPTNDNTPTLEWKDVADAEVYHLQISDSEDFSNLIIDESSLKDSEYTSISDLPEGLIYWRVKSIDAAGNESEYSQADSFTIDLTPPSVPILVEYSPDLTNNSTPNLSWKDIADADTYHLQISDSEDFSNLIVDETLLTDSRYTPILDLPEGIVYWRVKSIDAAGNESEYSQADSFTIDISVSSPTNLTLSFTPEKDKGVVNLSWEAPEDEDLTSYNIYRSTSDIEEISNLTPIATTDTQKTDYQDALTSSSNYYYAVTAIDALDNESDISNIVNIDYKRPKVFLSLEEKVYVEDIFTIELKTENMFDLFGFQFDLKFNSDLLEARSVTEGSFLNQDEIDTFWKEAEIDNQEGTVRNTSAIRLQKVGAEGAGVLANISLKSIYPGTSTLELENTKFTNPNAEPITIVKIEDSLTLTITAPWDVDKNWLVDIFDLALVGVSFGEEIPPETEPNPDVNRDGIVNIFDLVLIGNHFGEQYEVSPASPEKLFVSDTAKIKAKPRILEDNILRIEFDSEGTTVYGFQFNVNFNPKVLEALAVSEETLLANNKNRIFSPTPQIDNSAGKIANIVGCQTGDAAKSFKGSLSIIDFRIKDLDFTTPSTIQLSNVKLVNQQGNRVQPVIQNLVIDWEKLIVPEKTALMQNYPNPFNPETWIPFQLAERAIVSIHIYDLSGKIVRTLELGEKPAGVYFSKDRAAYWDGRNNYGERVSSGLYFFTIDAGGFRATRRMVIIR